MGKLQFLEREPVRRVLWAVLCAGIVTGWVAWLAGWTHWIGGIALGLAGLAFVGTLYGNQYVDRRPRRWFVMVLAAVAMIAASLLGLVHGGS